MGRVSRHFKAWEEVDFTGGLVTRGVVDRNYLLKLTVVQGQTFRRTQASGKAVVECPAKIEDRSPRRDRRLLIRALGLRKVEARAEHSAYGE